MDVTANMLNENMGQCHVRIQRLANLEFCIPFVLIVCNIYTA